MYSQSESISIRDRRMAYLSGFSGSGSVVVTEAIAALWTDSRYFIAAETQLDLDLWQLMKSGKIFKSGFEWAISFRIWNSNNNLIQPRTK